MKGERLSDVDLTALAWPTVVICHFDGEAGVPLPQNPAVHFQVTLRGDALSPSGEFIAFDGSRGDQVHGWMRRSLIVVDEVLKEVREGGTA